MYQHDPERVNDRSGIRRDLVEWHRRRRREAWQKLALGDVDRRRFLLKMAAAAFIERCYPPGGDA